MCKFNSSKMLNFNNTEFINYKIEFYNYHKKKQNVILKKNF